MMRKKQRTFISMALACMMVFAPAAQAMAATVYDVSEADSQVLFPGDELKGIGEDTVLTKDGEEIIAEDGSWENTSEKEAYVVSIEDEAVTITSAGYVLTVKNGSSESEDEKNGSEDNHYSFSDEEKAGLEEEKISEDIAYYKSGETVKITADEADEGYEFAGWSADTDEVSFTDVSAAETTFVMPDKQVVITAEYQEKAEPETEEANEEELADDEEEPADDEEEPADDEEEPADAAEEPAEPADAEEDEPDDFEIIIDIASGDASSEGGSEESDEEQNEEESIFKETEDSDEELFEIVVSDIYYESSDSGATDEDKKAENGETDNQDNDEAIENPVNKEPEKKYSVYVENGDLIGEDIENIEYAEGETVRITVTAADLSSERKEFSYWVVIINGSDEEIELSKDSQTATATDAVLEFTMPEGSVTVKAVYSDIPYYKVTVEDGNLVSGESEYAAGMEVNVIVTAPEKEGWIFSEWSISVADYEGDINKETDAKFTFIMPDNDVTITAEYYEVIKETESETETETEATKYTVTVNKGKTEISECEAGTTVTVTADSAETGWKFDHWNVDTSNVSLKDSGSSSTTFTMPESNVTLTAVYSQVKYTVTVENGTADQNSYNYGDTVTLASNYPASGKEFDTWTSSDSNVKFADASRASTTFTMPAENVLVSATYADGPSVYDNYISGIEEGGSYVQDDKLTFTAVGAGMSNTDPNPGDYRYVPVSYQIGNVSNTWSEEPYTTTMSIKTTGEYTLKVTFEKQVWNGNEWVADGTTDVRTVTFNIITPEEAVSTGDTTPVYIVAVIAAVACLIFIILLIVFIRRRKNQE